MGSQTVRVGDAVILIDDHRPAAVVRRPDARDVTVAWPDLDVGWCTPTLTVLASADAAWAVYRLTDLEMAAATPSNTASVAVRIATDGSSSVLHVPSGQCIGVTRHGLWTEPHGRQVGDSDTSETLTVFAGDDPPHTMSSDRPVAFVFDGDDGGIDVLIGTGRASSGLVRLPATDRLPDVLPTHTAVVVDDDALRERVMDFLPVRDTDVSHDWAWRTVMPPAELQDRAVAEALRQFDVADGQGRTVHVEGAWPDMVVALELPHPDVPSARLRREHRVFDASGRISPVGYLSVYVMEDIDTGQYPSATTDDDVITF